MRIPLKPHEVLFGSRRRISGTVYGTVVVMATLAAGSIERPDPWRLAVIVAATVLVLWAAHVYAHGLGESINNEKRLNRAELATIARSDFGILFAAGAPLTALMLGVVGVLEEPTAVWLAMITGLLTLGVEGLRYSRIERLGAVATIVVVAANLFLGVTIVALKALLAH
jgi:hypothetical protein